MSYLEQRRHELRKRRIQMIDGSLTVNSQTVDAGASARVFADGYWGFASAPDTDAAGLARIADGARRNARAMARFGPRTMPALAEGSGHGEHVYRGQPALGQAECVQRLSALGDWCRQTYPDLLSSRLLIADEHHTKRVATSAGSDVLSSIQRALCYVTFIAEGADGAPVELTAVAVGQGQPRRPRLFRGGAGAGTRSAVSPPAGQARRRAGTRRNRTASSSAPNWRACSPTRRWGTRARPISCSAARSRATSSASASPATSSR